MLKVPTEVIPSPIHGLGLFATAPIKAGEVVWEFHPKLDQYYSLSFLETLPECVADQLRKYSYINPEYPDMIVLCGDDARFINFPPVRRGESGYVETETPTLALGMPWNEEARLVAARDIQAGEELTVPLESDADYSRKLSTSF